jgi:formate hydrogenlyase transcriptional activator
MSLPDALRTQAEVALPQSEILSPVVLDQVRDYAIFTLDRDGRVTSWNAGAKRIKRYSAEEIIGQHLSCLYPAEDVETGKVAKALKTAAAQGHFEDEGWRVRKDGSRFWAHVVISALENEGGELRGFLKVTRDLTEERQAEELVLFEITKVLVRNLDIRRLLSAISASLRRVIPHDYAFLALYDEKSRKLRVQNLDAPDSEDFLARDVLLPVEGSPAGWAFTNREPLLLKRLESDRFLPAIMQRLTGLGLKSGCWLPLITGDGVIGTLSVGVCREDAFTEKHVRLLTQMASHVAIAMSNALAFRHVAEFRDGHSCRPAAPRNLEHDPSADLVSRACGTPSPQGRGWRSREAGEPGEGFFQDRLAEEKLYLEEELRTEYNLEEIIGESSGLKHVLKLAETVAPTDATVLILGETGTGKELVARAIHNMSARRERTFVKLNCAAIPSGLLESELFGHEKGAFTGAISQKIGRVELANQGTMFLDEVGDISLELQPKLLRVLQEREFERLGSTRTLSVDVRLIAATNRDLGRMVGDQQFRSDLYYRLKVFPIVLPPLRARREDIPALVRYFVQKYAPRMKKQIQTIPAETMEALTRWDWPGNVRELENFIERAVILSQGPALHAPLGELMAPREGGKPTREATLEGIERKHIIHVLREADGVIGGPHGAAARLGVKRTTLNGMMRRLGISRKDLYSFTVP